MSLTKEEIQAIQMQQVELDQERLRRMSAERSNAQMSMFDKNKEPNVIEYQLDLREELDRIYYRVTLLPTIKKVESIGKNLKMID